MTRLGLVWFVSICLQMSAISAPFVHLHADSAHDTDHHEGRIVHRHASAHEHLDEPEHDDHESSPVRLAADEILELVGSSGEPTSLVIGPDEIRLVDQGASVAPPDRVHEIARAVAPASPPPDDDGGPLPAPPDSATASPRGPPR